MSAQRKKSQEIQDYIIQNIEKNPQGITALASENFGISRQAVLKHINKLIADGILTAKGKTKNREYSLTIIDEFYKEYSLKNLEEDKIWREDVRPRLADTPANVIHIFEYGVTEMANNAIDHSEGKTVTLMFYRTVLWAAVSILDDGIGIFNKIQKKFNLDDPRHAILELSKGKLTTDPSRHSGEGIFFTSRMFDMFSISSGKLYLAHITNSNEVKGMDMLFDDKKTNVPGTVIHFRLSLNSTRTMTNVFDYYTTSESYGFDKTIVPVVLATYGDENLISRSQAKRLLARFEKFKEIMLDFEKVQRIGQAFADEIFRVFPNTHPEINLHAINTNEQVENMINRAKTANIG